MADVCLMLEGTYPYVSGGVSACAHQLISMLPKTNFTLVFIGTSSSELLTPKYKIPPNVVGIQEVFLFDDIESNRSRTTRLTKEEAEALGVIHRGLHSQATENGRFPSAPELARAMRVLFPFHAPGKKLFDSLASRDLWNLLLEEYGALAKGVPFIDFFYTWRSAHLPIYRILSQSYPKAQLYHSLCTGYAGLAAACASVQHEAPLFITEHGVYAHERAIEIAEADWFHRKSTGLMVEEDPSEALKAWWISMFRNMSRIAYGFASQIITLFDGNVRRQLADGAPKERSRIIPNGITLTFQGLRRKRASWGGPEAKQPFRLGFVGRVVPIKDLKTLIKSVYGVAQEYPDVTCDIIGPTEEDEDYFHQCQEMIGVLGLQEIIHFRGKKNVKEVYPELDCLLLTSISEGQPLVVLEANCAGVPVVSTQVGSCEELLEGREGADRLLGPSGLLAPIGNPGILTQQILKLIRSAELWEEMSLAGMERVANFYEERDLISRYEVLYLEHISGLASVSSLPPGVMPWQE